MQGRGGQRDPKLLAMIGAFLGALPALPFVVFVACIAFVVLLIALTVIDTKQNAPTYFDGNPALVQEVLDAKAPKAPIAKQTGISSPG